MAPFQELAGAISAKQICHPVWQMDDALHETGAWQNRTNTVAPVTLIIGRIF